MELLLTVFYTLIFLLIIYKVKFFQIQEFPTFFIPLIFSVKVICGVLLTLLYSNYYTDRSTADIFKYFDDSLILYNAAFTNFTDFLQMLFGIGNDNVYFDTNYYSNMNHWLRPFASNYYNDTHIIIRFNAVVRFFSLGHFMVHNVFFNFISMIGIVSFYKAFSKFPSIHKTLLILGICLLPSLVFWGSGVLKEGFILGGIGLLCFNLVKVIKNEGNFINWMVILLSIYILVRIKFYILFAMVPGIVAYFLIHRFKFKKVIIWHLIVISLFLGLGLNLKYLNPELDLVSMIVQKQKEFICLAEYMNSGSIYSIPLLEDNTTSILSAIPQAIFNSLFRPFIWESTSILNLASAIENAFLILFSTYVLFIKRKGRGVNMNLMGFAISFILITYTLIGLTTPVLGALVRYKVPALLFFILFISLLADQEKLNIFVNRKNDPNANN